MKRLLLTLPLLTSLIACGMSEGEFNDLVANKSCELAFECLDEAAIASLGWETVEDCVDASGHDQEDGVRSDCTENEKLSGEFTCCDFDGRAAETCAEEWEAQSTCDDYQSGGPDCTPYTNCTYPINP